VAHQREGLAVRRLGEDVTASRDQIVALVVGDDFEADVFRPVFRKVLLPAVQRAVARFL